MTRQKVRPFLWYNGRAKEAAEFYVALFANAQIIEAGERSVTFVIDGREFVAFDGGPYYEFTGAISFSVACETQAEIDRYWDALCDGGEPLRCGWVCDRFGVTWQIVPEGLGTMLDDADEARAARVMDVMLGMVRLDIAALERAFAGEI